MNIQLLSKAVMLLMIAALSACTSAIEIQDTASEIPAFELFEVDFQTAAIYDNPYDPEEIDIQAVFFTPGGDSLQVPAFWYQPYEIDSVNQRINAVRQGHWKLRFTPELVGAWRFFIRAHDREGNIARSKARTFMVTPNPKALGFIQADPVHQQYFRYENSNTLFYGFGLNSDVNTFNKSEAADPNNGNWGTGSGYLPPWTGSHSTGLSPENLYHGYAFQTNMLNSLGINGGKALRINTDRYYHPLEAKADLKPYDSELSFEEMGFGLGKYHQAMSFILDELYREAEKYKIGIVHTPWDAVADQPYSAGFCYAEKLDQTLIKRKLRYILARWGYSTSYWMTEYFNEFQGAKVDSFWQSILTWQQELDPYQHPITLTSATFGESGPDVYLENAYTADCYKFKLSPATQMPACLGEFGEHYILATKDPHSYDPEGNWVRQTLWNALVSKWAGGFTWWTHPIYGEKGCDAYKYIYPALAKFLANEQMHQEGRWDTLSIGGGLQGFEHVRGITNAAKTKALVYIIRTPPGETQDRKPLSGKHIKLSLHTGHTYQAEWWHTQSGEIMRVMDKQTGEEGILEIPIPDHVSRDAALKIYAK